MFRGENPTHVVRELWPSVSQPKSKAKRLMDDPAMRAYMKGLEEASAHRVRQYLEAINFGFEERMKLVVRVARLGPVNPTASLAACKRLDQYEGRTEEDYRKVSTQVINFYAAAVLQSSAGSGDKLQLPDVCGRVLEDSAEVGGQDDTVPPEQDAGGSGCAEDAQGH